MTERFAQMPSALRAAARWERLGPGAVPCMLVHPDWESDRRVPVVLWMHGRTANKELDPGRYLRWMRTSGGGIGTCAVDLPGHGERIDADLQTGNSTPLILKQIVDEIDGIVDSLAAIGAFDMDRIAIGGMSAGGMAALARLCKPHQFKCASVEATTGAWRLHLDANVTSAHQSIVNDLDPIDHLDGWREIPIQAIHAVGDEMVSFKSQHAFIEALRQRYRDSALINLVTYENTGAPGEHIGFGRFSAEAKDRQRDFLHRWLFDPAG